MGHRITRAALHLSVDEVKERMNRDVRPWVRRHWWIIYNTLVEQSFAREIALETIPFRGLTVELLRSRD